MDFVFIKEAFPIILAAVPMTLFLSLSSTLIGLIIGLLIALTRIYEIPVLRKISIIFVSFVRGTPLLVQIYLAYYAFPYIVYEIGRGFGCDVSIKNIPALIYAIVAFSFNAAAYLSEAIRSALQSVNSGQMEAAYSVGMTTTEGMKRIIIPQALIVAIPNLENLFLGFIKGTSLAFMISIKEVMAVAVIEASIGYNYIEAYLLASIIYLVIGFIFERLFKLVENNLKKYKAGVTL